MTVVIHDINVHPNMSDSELSAFTNSIFSLLTCLDHPADAITVLIILLIKVYDSADLENIDLVEEFAELIKQSIITNHDKPDDESVRN